MIGLRTIPNLRNIADNALGAGVILACGGDRVSTYGSRGASPRMTRTRARSPLSGIFDVHLTRRMVVAEDHTGEDGNGVLLVVDVRQRGDMGVHVVCKVLVADLQQEHGK